MLSFCFIISIHLMLLFNFMEQRQPKSWSYFNTSNVTIQLDFLILKCHILAYFNTSNVTIQLISIPYLYNALDISIHLMLLFNKNSLSNYATTAANFNTSNVTIQRNSREISSISSWISIHLMLLFNSSNVVLSTVLGAFQYI